MIRSYRREHGLTLIELLISVTIGLLLAAAATYLFVSTNRISKVIDAKSQQQEVANIVLDIIGRDLKNAGFYPANFPTTAASSKFQGVYSNIVSAGKSHHPHYLQNRVIPAGVRSVETVSYTHLTLPTKRIV